MLTKLSYLRMELKKRHMLLLLLLVIVFVFKAIPHLAITYTKHIYPCLGSILSHISGIMPLPIGDVFITLSIAWVIAYPCYAIFYKKKKKTLVLWNVAEYLLWIYVWFYAAWGLNYSQPNIYSRIGINPVDVSKSEFRSFANNYIDSLNASYQDIKGLDKANAEKEILHEYKILTRNEPDIGINTPFNNHPHVKTMLFSRLSSMAGVTGSMGPFFCEFTLNSELQPHEYPATYAHELAHFLGISNEGEANFYSYIVCTKSHDKAIRFSGYYQILFHVIVSVDDILGDEEGRNLIKRINPKVLELAKADRRYWLSRRSQVVDKAQNFVYNLYLRGNNIEEGTKSYSRVIGIIMAWRCHCHDI